MTKTRRKSRKVHDQRSVAGRRLAAYDLPAPAPEAVALPPYYNRGAYETILVIEDITQFFDGAQAFLAGAALKHLARAPHKDLLAELKKAQFYLNRLIWRVEDGGPGGR